MQMEAPARVSKVFDERVNSLMADHYCKRVDTRLPHLWLVRLHHMSNGNDVVLRGYPLDHMIIQTTNLIVTHKEIVE